MRITSDDFLSGIRINRRYFFSVVKGCGVCSTFIFTDRDLELIRDRLPVRTHKTARIVTRCNDLLKENA